MKEKVNKPTSTNNNHCYNFFQIPSLQNWKQSKRTIKTEQKISISKQKKEAYLGFKEKKKETNKKVRSKSLKNFENEIGEIY